MSSIEKQRYRIELSKHLPIEKFAMVVFIISLCLGEKVAIGPIKLSYFSSILMIVVSLYSSNNRIRITIENKKYSRLLKYCYVWISYAVIQLLWAKDYSLYFSFFRSLLINVFIIYMIVVFVQCFDDWILVLKSFIISLTISLCVGFWEMLTGRHIIKLAGGSGVYYLFRPIAFYGNGNDYATVLMLGVFALLLFLAIYRGKTLVKIFALLLLSASIVQIIRINCRGAVYSLFLLAGLLVILFSASKMSETSKKSETLINISLTFIIMLTIFIIFLNNSTLDLIERYSEEVNRGSDYRRLELIEGGLSSIINTFGFGTGPGQSILVSGTNLHFFYLEILAEYGIIVGGYLLILFFQLTYIAPSDIGPFENALTRSFPIVIILLGVASSGMMRLRATWVVFALIYTLVYRDYSYDYLQK